MNDETLNQAGNVPDAEGGNDATPPEAAHREPAAEGAGAPVPGRPDDSETASSGAGTTEADDFDVAEFDRAAQDQVAKLLAVAEITTVVCVDDNFEPDISVILDAIGSAGADISEKMSTQLGVTIDGDPADSRPIWAPQVREAWEGYADDQRRRYASGVMRLLEEDDQPDAGHLGDLIPASITFLPIIASEWEVTYKAQVLAGTTGKTLVLFDRAHGTEPNLGIKLAADLHDDDTTDSVWAGLLTHTVDPEDEIEQRPLLAAEDSRIVGERFVVISKRHLEATPSTFPHGLKVTLMAPAAHRLRKAVTGAITSGTRQAEKGLELDPYEFERAVFATAITEGIWEPDMLLRLFNVLIRAEVHKSLYDSSQIAEDAALLRRFSAVDLEPNKNQSFAAAHRIRHQEIYEEPDHINGRHLPIELGDIFEIVDGSKFRTVVLVEQPCDLMVRSKGGKGRRANDLTHAHLVELKDEPHAQFGFELPAYLAGKSWHAWFSKMVVVPFEALDFCVYTGNGTSQFDTNAEPPTGLWPAWDARHPHLKRQAKKLVKAVTAESVTGLTDAMFKADYIEHRCASHYATTKPLVCTVEGSTVSFNIRRINRLLPPYSRALLVEHSAYRARADFEPNFAA